LFFLDLIFSTQSLVFKNGQKESNPFQISSRSGRNYQPGETYTCIVKCSEVGNMEKFEFEFEYKILPSNLQKLFLFFILNTQIC
jgi:hypothetical protein